MTSTLNPSTEATEPKAEKLLSFDEEGLQFAWDATSLKNLQTCPRYYYYTNIEGYKSKSPSVHLWFGGHYATALEHYYKHMALGKSSQEALCLVVREALEATWVRYEDADGNPRGGPARFESPEKTRENLIRTIIWYVDQFEQDSAEVIHLANGKPAVELSFTLEVDDDIIFCGHLDRLVTYSGEAYVMDQKTSKATITPYFMKQWDTDAQMSMYTFAGKSILSSPVKGVIIDAAQVAVGFSRFERGFTLRNDAQLEEWYDHSMMWIELGRKFTRENFFPMNLTSCGNYGGCPFQSVCSKSPKVREHLLKGDFERRKRWDPLERR